MPESLPEGAAGARPEQAGPQSKGEPDPLIGRVVNGRFKIISVIARGGMGKVYKAEQSPLNRICALKVLSPKYEGDRDPEFHKRFFLEASTAAKLTHPNTVTIFDYGQEGDDLYFIAMEFIEGRTLHRVLRDEGPFVEIRVAHVAGQICRSLREAHALGVVHRDLKPGNILLTDRGDEQDNVKVLDFGLVKDVSGEAEDLTQAGLFMGSPKYMAPEQILGGEITGRTDIYSLGVMMYEMLSGRVPFDRGASVGTLMAHVNDAPPPMRQINPKLVLSRTMENIVARCLEKDANKRFASMKDLLNALKRVGLDEGAPMMTDTQESMPMARLDLLGASSVRGISTDSGPQTGPHGSISTPPGDGRNSSQITDSALGPPAAPPLDTDAMAKMRPKSRPYVWFLAAAVAAGIAVTVMATAKPQAGGDSTTSTSAPAGNGGPVGTQEPTANPTTTATTTASAADPAGTVRTVKVESDPSGASVNEGNTEVCSSTPCDVVWKGDAARGEHKLQLNKKGFKTTKLTVSATDTKVSSKLDVAAAVYVGPRTPQPPPDGTGKRKPNPYGD
jgi:eukaryotic-like serine/threonine-protein kinase